MGAFKTCAIYLFGISRSRKTIAQKMLAARLSNNCESSIFRFLTWNFWSSLYDTRPTVNLAVYVTF